MKKIVDLFRGDGLAVSSSIFPRIDTDKIAHDLRLDKQGSERGENDLPQTTEKTLDSVELEAIERIEEIRRKGLENYDENRSAYARRLGRASEAHVQVKSTAEAASGEFTTLVKGYRANMTRPVEEVKGWHQALEDFRRLHQIARPAFPSSTMATTVAIIAVCFLIETLLNSYLFAAKNELSYLGGFFAAALVSVVNIGAAIVAGLFIKNIYHRRLTWKFFGWLVTLGWFCFAVLLGFATAHFRDALEAGFDWSVAATMGIETLFATPLELAGFESWLLLLWGILTAFAVVLKFALTGESYPGYSRISEHYERACRRYSTDLDDALSHLKDERDQFIEDLTDASRTVKDEVSDAIDAVYGQRLMRQQLVLFLEQCDVRANRLLKIYRDANRSSRSTPAPEYFDLHWTFEKIEPTTVDEAAKVEAEEKLDGIANIVERAVDHIHASFQAVMDDYPDLDVLIGLNMHGGESKRTKVGPIEMTKREKPQTEVEE